MKTFFTSAVIALLLAGTLLFDSCRSKKEDPLAQNIQKLVPRNVIDTLRTLGMNIIETGKPAQITGIYEINPMALFASSSSSDRQGSLFSAYRVRFSDQNEVDQSLKMDYKNGPESGSGIGGFIAGSGNKFSAFFETSAISATSTFKMAVVFTGDRTSNGIQNMQYAFYLKEKNDPAGRIVKVGTTRAFKDTDGLADKISSLRRPADDNELTTTETIWHSAAQR
jgi:hypothetical protein